MARKFLDPWAAVLKKMLSHFSQSKLLAASDPWIYCRIRHFFFNVATEEQFPGISGGTLTPNQKNDQKPFEFSKQLYYIHCLICSPYIRQPYDYAIQGFHSILQLRKLKHS